MEAHAAVAAINIPQATVEAVLADWTTADVPMRTRAALTLIEAMTLRPSEINPAFIEARKREGLDDEGLRWAASVCFQYNFINRVTDAFDFKIPDDQGRRRLAAALDLASRVIPMPPGDANWTLGADGPLRPRAVERGWSRLLGTPGVTTTTLRHFVDGFVAREWGVARKEASDVPQALQPYLRKLAKAAYKITDEDLEALRTADYNDERIYEITMVGAMSAALVGLEAVYEACYGAEARQQYRS